MSGGTLCKTPRMDTGWICKDELTAAINHPHEDKRDISFETEGILSPAADGKLRLQSERVKAMHVPAKGLMGYEMEGSITVRFRPSYSYVLQASPAVPTEAG